MPQEPASAIGQAPAHPDASGAKIRQQAACAIGARQWRESRDSRTKSLSRQIAPCIQPCATAAMTDDMLLLPFDLPAVRRRKLTVDFDGGNQSSDAGRLLLREAERRLGVCRRLADAMPDRRDSGTRIMTSAALRRCTSIT